MNEAEDTRGKEIEEMVSEVSAHRKVTAGLNSLGSQRRVVSSNEKIPGKG